MTVKIENVLGEVVETNGMRVVCRFDRSALVAARARVEGDELAASSVGGLIKIALADRLVVATLGNWLRTMPIPAGAGRGRICR